jgi:NAD(P)-dependent dehydrogenase (short-subunit alcohol dehydrogenase family)
LRDFENNPKVLEDDLDKSFRVNVIGLINTFNVFTPLVLESNIKKVITLTSAMGVPDFVNESEMDVAPSYAISKAGVNMVIAKYNTMYKRQGILFLGICPGSVNTATVPQEPRK